MVWALVDESQTAVLHKFDIVGTGWDLEEVEGDYLGTVHDPAGFVWHVFYNGEDNHET